MGYCYGPGGLACDGGCGRCGSKAGVRKRTCPHTVLGDSLRSSGRHRLPWCQPPALCGPCLKRAGGSRALHAKCEAAAAADQARSDAIEAGLDAGESYVLAAWGDWQAGVPAGMVGVLFGSRAGKSWHLMPAADYEGDPGRLSDYPAAQPWADHPE